MLIIIIASFLFIFSLYYFFPCCFPFKHPGREPKMIGRGDNILQIYRKSSKILPVSKIRPGSSPYKAKKNEKWELMAFLLNNFFQNDSWKKYGHGRILEDLRYMCLYSLYYLHTTYISWIWMTVRACVLFIQLLGIIRIYLLFSLSFIIMALSWR
jgi:hypothetical protein